MSHTRFIVEMTFQRKLKSNELSLLRTKVSSYCGELVRMGNHVTFLAVFRYPGDQQSFITYFLPVSYLARSGNLHIYDAGLAKSVPNGLSVPLRDYKVHAGPQTFEHPPFSLPLGSQVQIVGKSEYAGSRGSIEDYFFVSGHPAAYFVRLDHRAMLHVFSHDQIDPLHYNLVATTMRSSEAILPFRTISEQSNMTHQEVLERLNELTKNPSVETIEIVKRKPSDPKPEPLTFWRRLGERLSWFFGWGG